MGYNICWLPQSPSRKSGCSFNWCGVSGQAARATLFRNSWVAFKLDGVYLRWRGIKSGVYLANA
jgi:hypothetical protein